MRQRFAIVVCAGVLALASSASAGPPPTGVPVVVPADGTIVTVQFISANASAEGEIYFLGSGNVTTVLNPAPDTGPPGLGTFLFNNQTAVPNAIFVIGVFNGGDVLHFANRIIAPAADVDLFRTDTLADIPYFAFDNVGNFLYMEETREPGSDLDYNDTIICLIFTPVPGPAGIAVMGPAARPRLSTQESLTQLARAVLSAARSTKPRPKPTDAIGGLRCLSDPRLSLISDRGAPGNLCRLRCLRALCCG